MGGEGRVAQAGEHLSDIVNGLAMTDEKETHCNPRDDLKVVALTQAEACWCRLVKMEESSKVCVGIFKFNVDAHSLLHIRLLA